MIDPIIKISNRLSTFNYEFYRSIKRHNPSHFIKKHPFWKHERQDLTLSLVTRLIRPRTYINNRFTRHFEKIGRLIVEIISDLAHRRIFSPLFYQLEKKSLICTGRKIKRIKKEAQKLKLKLDTNSTDKKILKKHQEKLEAIEKKIFNHFCSYRCRAQLQQQINKTFHLLNHLSIQIAEQGSKEKSPLMAVPSVNQKRRSLSDNELQEIYSFTNNVLSDFHMFKQTCFMQPAGRVTERLIDFENKFQPIQNLYLNLDVKRHLNLINSIEAFKKDFAEMKANNL